MKDKTTTVQILKNRAAKFVKERDWNQFHSPKNLSMAIATEASELMELFLWDTTEESHKTVDEKRKAVENELADVICAALSFANATNIDIATVLERKVQEIEAKYPIDKVKGKRHKYTYYTGDDV